MVRDLIKDLSTLEKGDKFKITENTGSAFSEMIGDHEKVLNKTLKVTNNNSPYNLRKEEESWIPGFLWPLIRPGGLQFNVEVVDEKGNNYTLMVKRDRIVTVYSFDENPKNNSIHGNVESIKIL